MDEKVTPQRNLSCWQAPRKLKCHIEAIMSKLIYFIRRSCVRCSLTETDDSCLVVDAGIPLQRNYFSYRFQSVINAENLCRSHYTNEKHQRFTMNGMNNQLIVPNSNDILLGRGGINHTHPGNVQLRSMAGKLAVQYNAAGKKVKTQMSRELVQCVHSMWPAGRFLQRNKPFSRWEVAQDDIARSKASQALRDAVTEYTSTAGKRDGSESPAAASVGGDSFSGQMNGMGLNDRMQPKMEHNDTASSQDYSMMHYLGQGQGQGQVARRASMGSMGGSSGQQFGMGGTRELTPTSSSADMGLNDTMKQQVNISNLETMIKQHTQLMHETLVRDSHASAGTGRQTAPNWNSQVSSDNQSRMPDNQSRMPESLVPYQQTSGGFESKIPDTRPSASNVQYYENVFMARGAGKPVMPPESVESSDVDMDTDRNEEDYEHYNSIRTKFNQNSRINPIPEMETIGENHDGSDYHEGNMNGNYPADLRNQIRAQLESSLIQNSDQQERRHSNRHTSSMYNPQHQMQMQVQYQTQMLEQKMMQQLQQQQQQHQQQHQQHQQHLRMQLLQSRLASRMPVNTGFNGATPNKLEFSSNDVDIRNARAEAYLKSKMNERDQVSSKPKEDPNKFMSKRYRGMMRKMKKQQTQAVPNGMPLQGNELHVQTSTSSSFSMGAETFSNLDTFSNVSSGVSSEKNLDMNDFDWQGQIGSHFQG